MAAEETQRAFDVTQQFLLSGDITPATITADQNNYNPTGLDTAGVLRLASDANNRALTGIAGGADGRVLILLNVGTTTIVLSNQNASSTAANRFDVAADIELAASETHALLYDATSSRWRSMQSAVADGAISARRILANAVDDFKLRDSGALSVIGRSANSTGDPGDISATPASGAVLRESGSTIGFGTIATAGIANDAVTYAKMQNISAASLLLGRGSAGGAGDPQEITLGTNLSMSGTTLNASGSGSALVSFKEVVRMATTGNITLSGLQTVDGVVGVAADRVLVKNQTTGSENGIYTQAVGAWSRSADADTSAEVMCGITVGVCEGTVNADTFWMLTTNDPIVLAVTSLTFEAMGLLTNTAPVDVDAAAAAVGTSLRAARADHKHDIAANAVGNAEFRTSGARSVVGRSVNTTGNVADIAGTTAGFALTDDGTTVAFRALDTIGEDLNLTGDINSTLTSGNNNDYAPTGFSTATTIRLTPNAATSTITGIAAGTDGRVILLHNIDGTVNIFLSNQDAASTAANRLIVPGGTALYALGPGCGVFLWYDSTTSRWRIVGEMPGVIPQFLTLAGDISHTLGSGNNNDNTPTGIASASTIRYTPNAAGSTLTGLANGADGRIFLLLNIDTAVSITITHQDAASTAANRFALPDGLPITLGPTSGLIVQYDSTSSRWRALQPTVTNLPQAVALQGDLTPATLAAGDTNDYAPTSLAISTVLRITPHAQSSALTGITGGADGRILVVKNVATASALRLKNENASSTAANRFSLNFDIYLGPGEAVTLIYDSTLSRWTAMNQVVSDHIQRPDPILEDFILGSAETGEIGVYGWTFTTFGIVGVNVVADHPGIVQTQSSATIGAVNRLKLSNADTGTQFREDMWTELVMIFAPATATFDLDFRQGLLSDASANPPGDGVFVEKLAADANYQVVTRASAAQTRTGSGVAAANGTYFKVKARKNGANIDWFANDVFVVQSTGNLPTAATGLIPVHQQIPTAANARSWSSDLFHLYFANVTR